MAPLAKTSLGFDHVHFYVEDVARWGPWFQQAWGFQQRGYRWQSESFSVWLSQGDVHVILSQPTMASGAVHAYLQCHPQGVADIGIRVEGLLGGEGITATGSLLYASATPLETTRLQHSLIERRAPLSLQDPILPGFEVEGEDPVLGVGLTHIDHVVLNVPQSEMLLVAQWYEQTLGWSIQYRYQVETKRSGLNSVVVGVSPDLGKPPLQLAINEPIGATSQIQEFIEAHRGPGIQHVALHSADLTATVQTLKQRGIRFLPVPLTYYQSLSSAFKQLPNWSAIQAQEVLVDWVDPQDPAQLLLQTFTDTIFAEPTFFFEIIQRYQGAQGFGEQNFQALFEAIEKQQYHRQSLCRGHLE